MALRRKVRQIGNSLALAIPNEIFEFLNLNPENIKYKLTQNETGNVFIVILGKDTIALDEKKFQKHGKSSVIIIPKPLCVMWNIGLNEEQNRELEISYDETPFKWKLCPAY